ncbi:MAG: exodeoxyribonuclease III [Spirochaetes bacterium]|uniref:Exodeoxyribonuclease III n=1 Tax=Candidatus Ornithospirochaeta stercoravium TaxID=2840897 RepID=A0A9D9IAL8_9SPIO|nr:exodeoxyribonuclease III [Candidatus Ornithospirochaeta stercoravium]
MKLISWNVNGIRSCLNKGFLSFASSSDADIIAIQETKAKEEDVDIVLPGYERYFYSAEKKGYSGTAIFTRIKPISVTYGLDDDEYNHEGRVITLEYDDFYFVCVYVPNSQENLKRIDFRLGFDEAFRAHLVSLKKKKGVIATGDFNVAKEPIDLKNPKPNEGHAGYSIEERESFRKTLSEGFIDTFRYFYPDKEGEYSWWSYMFHAREKNAGWRIDYFIVSDDMKEKLQDAAILKDVYGSDHAPVSLILK